VIDKNCIFVIIVIEFTIVSERKMKTEKIRYSDLFWLFVAGSLFGVLVEGVFCMIAFGHWETHVVSVWGHFCIIYGIGASAFYACAIWLKRENMLVQFLVTSFICDTVEIVAGALLEFGLGMRAWDYHGELLNFRGYISLKMTAGWGIIGLISIHLIMPHAENVLLKMRTRNWDIACMLFTIFMVIDLALTTYCLIRWSMRYHGATAHNAFDAFIDAKYNDDYMKHRFVEWKFIKSARGS
jgi:uncharacterized membrane protein